MKTLKILLAVMLIMPGLIAQSIRKNYLEMTEGERDALIDAFYQLRNNGDLINDLATFHSTFFNFDNTFDPTRLDIHFNLPDEPERDIFFAWHRRQMFEMEQAMQEIYPDLSLAYWNSSLDQSVNSPLWAMDFLGQFNIPWNLNRNLGGMGMLPSPGLVTSVQAISDFLIYSNTFERGEVHDGAHMWTGGAMAGAASPRDPVFYLHHSFLDKLWQEWETVNNSSSFIRNSMIRYDGTYSFNGQLIPLVNPNDIVDSRVYGVFYANDQLAVLDNYTVNNTYNDQESFVYQYNIQIGDNFIVPDQRNCKTVSTTRINLLPGFQAQEGSVFLARIETVETLINNAPVNGISSYNHKPFDNIYPAENVYSDQLPDIHLKEFTVSPNPFTSEFEVSLGTTIPEINVTIIDFTGKTVYQHWYYNVHTFKISGLEILSSGIYLLSISDDQGYESTRKVIRK